ncbi:MAG: GGDEF domain-containing protein [Paucibacter sp.]|nr:GGDEF domain-containing protein [Roseateles sp.]
MSSPRSNTGLPSVLRQLGKMTAIRDTYLVEQSLLRTLGPLLGVTCTSLYRIDAQGLVVRSLHHSRAVTADEGGMQRVTENIEEVANEEGLPEELLDLLENVRLLDKPSSRQHGAEHLICYPIHGGGELCGYFVLHRELDISSAEDSIVRGVLEVFNNFYDLLDTSQRDRLTGLLNRYSLELNLDRLWNLLHARSHAPATVRESRREELSQRYWLAILDVDHFKNINDTYGHLIGDEVLIVVTRLLEASFRRSDLIYRYGGEEFIAIVAANDLEGAVRVFERARRKIESFKFPRVGQVTISGGFSGADPVVLPQEVINRADSALYESKKAGRNCISHYESLVQQGVLKEVSAGSVDLF